MDLPLPLHELSHPEQVQHLLGVNAQLQAQCQELLDLVRTLRATVERQQAHIDKLVAMTFGRRSERLEGPTLFEDLPVESLAPNAPEESESPTSSPSRKGHGRRRNSSLLPRKREIIELSEAERLCPCCSTTRIRIGEDVRERLDYTPASIFIREIVLPTYACRVCESNAQGAQIVQPTPPPEVVPRSGIDAGLLAHVIVSKYVDHLPLYRQESILARHGWMVSRTRLCDLLTRCAMLLNPLYQEMQRRMKRSYVIHVDETSILLLRPRRTAQAWTYIGDCDNPYVLFDVTNGRGEEFPAAFLHGYSGFVQADGYSGYNRIHGDGLRHVGCWAHVRRKFFDSRGNEPAKASQALAFIRTLYAVEKEIVDRKLTGEAVVELRKARASPVYERFREWLEAEHRTSLPRSPYGEAVTYAWNQWVTLGRYLTDARLRIGRVER